MSPGSGAKSEYMKRYREPRWDECAPCYRERLHYRRGRRLLEQAHAPWLWDAWRPAGSSDDSASSASSGPASPAPRGAPGSPAPPAGPAAREEPAEEQAAEAGAAEDASEPGTGPEGCAEAAVGPVAPPLASLLPAGECGRGPGRPAFPSPPGSAGKATGAPRGARAGLAGRRPCPALGAHRPGRAAAFLRPSGATGSPGAAGGGPRPLNGAPPRCP